MCLRSFAAAIFAIFLQIPPDFAQEAAPASDPARIAAARDLMAVMGVTKQMDGLIGAMSKGLSEVSEGDKSEAGRKLKQQFEAVLAKFAGYKEEMFADFAALYAETFSAAEMKEVADFYRSGTGAKFGAMTPALMEKGAAIGIRYSQKMRAEIEGAGAAPQSP